MARLWKNNAYGTLASTLAIGGTSMTLTTGHGDRFPVVVAPDEAYVTLKDNAGNIEIVKVTARASASNVLTIVRAQEGTTARAWAAADTVEQRITAAALTAYETPNGEYRSVQIYTATGANTWTKPAGLKRVRVTLVSGGGGSGGAAAATAVGGGGGGAVAVETIEAASLGATETATVGAGGTAGGATPTNGGTGGTSSFGAHLSATGGVGSTASTSLGAEGGTSSGATIRAEGGGGGPGVYVAGATQCGGNGGASLAGGSRGGIGLGVAGEFPGGGAGGAMSTGGTYAGAAGANGIVIVEEFF